MEKHGYESHIHEGHAKPNIFEGEKCQHPQNHPKASVKSGGQETANKNETKGSK